jgi:hypothetical protein
MTQQMTGQLAALALQADDQTRVEAVVACARYCGTHATRHQAQAFVAGQIRMLSELDDELSAEIRSGWEWLAGEIEDEALSERATRRRAAPGLRRSPAARAAARTLRAAPPIRMVNAVRQRRQGARPGTKTASGA